MNKKNIRVRKGQAPGKLSRADFRARFFDKFTDPAFGAEASALKRIEIIAWDGYTEHRKAPLTHPAGRGYADPSYDLSDEWRAARQAIRAAEKQQKDPASPSRVLVISGADRNDGTCPGEISKTWRLSRIVIDTLRKARIQADDLDLSLITSEYGKQIHPCKGCVSTAMPLCHWPCSCYPNHALGQVNDWMNEIYPRWSAAHGIIIVTPVYWYQVPSALKLMIDRLVCADGGNTDPSSTDGKDAKKAKQIELAGWPYPKHLSGRTYGLVVHGDVAGIEGVRRSLSDWLDWMGLIDAGSQARLDRFIGYYKPYATSHDELDQDKNVQEEVRNVARAVAKAVRELRAGTLSQPDEQLETPRQK
ncbi:MAG: flavodoxin family protein [Pseudomonadota bacterium]|nr:flavodoxin family protein [Burkholderiaceae bacterium]MDQ3445024.1 flavodoxin family protein [Pseudomonadota bacterium]